MCRPLPPEVFGQPVAPSSSSTSCTTWATRRTVPKPHWGIGIQVDAPLVGQLGVGPARVPGVELHGGHLHRPQHAGQFGDAQFVGVPAVAREVHPDGLHPRRRAVRDPLLVHLLAGHAGREPVQHAGPLAQRPDDAVAHRQVVAGQVQLGLAPGREVHPVRVGDPHRPVPDLEFYRLGHKQNVAAPQVRGLDRG